MDLAHQQWRAAVIVIPLFCVRRTSRRIILVKWVNANATRYPIWLTPTVASSESTNVGGVRPITTRVARTLRVALVDLISLPSLKTLFSQLLLCLFILC
jgi:hypothetical protein